MQLFLLPWFSVIINFCLKQLVTSRIEHKASYMWGFSASLSFSELTECFLMGMNYFIYIFSLGSVIIAQVTGNWLIKIPINRLGITNQIKNFFLFCMENLPSSLKYNIYATIKCENNCTSVHEKLQSSLRKLLYASLSTEPEFTDTTCLKFSCTLVEDQEIYTLTLLLLHKLLVKTSFNSDWLDVSDLVEICETNGKDINISHVWRSHSGIFCNNGQTEYRSGPSEAIAHTVSRGHLALISKAYTNTHIQRDGHT